MTKWTVARAWVNGLSAADAKRVTDLVIHSTSLLDRLRDMIAARQAAIAQEESMFSQYETPNWDYRQAHLNGRKQELRELLDLIKLYPDKGA